MFSPFSLLNNLTGKKVFKSGGHYLLVSGVLLLITVIMLGNHAVAWNVEVEGENVAEVEKRSTASKAVERLLEEKEEKCGSEVITKQDIEINPTVFWNENFSKAFKSQKELADILNSKIDFVTKGTAIVVNGREEAYVRNKEEGRAVLEKIKEGCLPSGDKVNNLTVEFEENVELVQKGEIVAGEISSLYEAVQKLGAGARATPPHPAGKDVPTGDSLITVVSSYEQKTVEEIPYDIIENKDFSMGAGERELVQEGSPGKAEVIYRVREKNGETLHKSLVDREVMKEPSPQIQASGSSFVLASRSGENIYRPVSGRISSDYGMRHGDLHKGVDIAAPHGARIVAMSSGKVESAGPYGSYGRVVVINHGNNLVTKYAHLSQVVVNQGDSVGGGEMIGRVGSSGNSTGPHLHFEVWVNGQTVNPVRYLNGGI